MQGEAQGIMTETAGALVTASLFSKPAQWQSGNFPLNHRKKMVGNMACTRNHRKMYTVHLCTAMCKERHAHGPHTYHELYSNSDIYIIPLFATLLITSTPP